MKPLVLIILDGWGLRDSKEANGIKEASLVCYPRLLQEYPSTRLECSGPAVGLPEGVIGNSEVGHMTIGAGRVVYQGLSRIYAAIADRSFFKNSALQGAVQTAKKRGSRLHLIGLVSDGAVHSQIDHLLALLELCQQEKLSRVFIHCFMDGRDTAPTSGITYMKSLLEKMESRKTGRVATICGRYWAMDRDNRWDRIQAAYTAMVLGIGRKEFFPVGAVKAAYDRKETDEFIKPIVLCRPDGQPVGTIQDQDAVIFFNFRADRAREITRAFNDPAFGEFPRPVFPKLSAFSCMTEYDSSFQLPIAFTKEVPRNILAQLLSERGVTQLRIAETEKYAHVTYFFNGGEEKIFPGEERLLIPSPRHVPTYDQIPEMAAPEVTEKFIEKFATKKFAFVVLNFANPDMVGHTAVRQAVIKAVETVDRCLGSIVEAVTAQGGTVLLTADHGNCERMRDENGEPHTQHTLNPVPFILIDERFRNRSGILASEGRLCDIAPTILELMGIPKPVEMTGKSLLKIR